ncbi:MAG: hypothetical protein AAGG75_05135 [Bacteroidota bacterium]
MLQKVKVLKDLKIDQLKLVVNLDKVKGGAADKPTGVTQATSYTRSNRGV